MIKKTEMKDPTNPPYYTSYPVDLTCITITRHMGFDAGTAFAYVWRAGKKESLVLDIDKALWYMNDMWTHGGVMPEQISDAATALFRLVENIDDHPRFDILNAIMIGNWEYAIKLLKIWRQYPEGGIEVVAKAMEDRLSNE